LNAPLKFFGLLERPAERGAVVIKLGMALYDFFTREQKTVPKHVFRNRAESLALFPDLNPEIIFTGTYYDGAMPSPERIAIEVLLDAAAENEQAVALNYISFQSSQGDTVVLKDETSGEQINLRPKIVVNAAGPWIDLVNRSIGEDSHFISGTKGSHLILDHPELRRAIGDNEFFFENKDGRIVLIFPILDRVMIGTSDLRVENPDGVVITEEEIDYFFGMIGRVFPKIKVDRSQIVFSFSGVRPLQHSEKGATGQISRNHKVEILEPDAQRPFPVLSLVGGKWTSFRAFSEEAADEVLRRLEMPRIASTENLRIGGSKGFPKTETERLDLIGEITTRYQISRERSAALLDTYGMNSLAILEGYGVKQAEALLPDCPEISLGELAYILEHEDVIHLDDLLLRRTLLGKLGKVSAVGLDQIAAAAGRILGWTDEQTEAEVTRTKRIFREAHTVNLNHG
jgi:glycerol-3-phosphate dehydrogenase